MLRSHEEVEGVINRLEGVVDSSVVGIPDEKWGEKVVAVIAVKPHSGLKPGDVDTHCREHLHDWKCPKHIVFVEDLPKNAMGKVMKEDVRKLFVR